MRARRKLGDIPTDESVILWGQVKPFLLEQVEPDDFLMMLLVSAPSWDDLRPAYEEDEWEGFNFDASELKTASEPSDPSLSPVRSYQIEAYEGTVFASVEQAGPVSRRLVPSWIRHISNVHKWNPAMTVWLQFWLLSEDKSTAELDSEVYLTSNLGWP